MLRNTLQPLNWAKAVYTVALWAVFFLVSLATAQADPVTLAWNPSSSSSVIGYRVYYGQTSENLTAWLDISKDVCVGTPPSVTPPSVTCTHTTPDLPAGTYYFAVKAFDSPTNESGFSNVVGSTTYTFTTNQPTSGLTLSYNGVSHVTPFTVRATVDSSQQQISAPTPQSNYTFSSWSDGGAATHEITIGASPQTITANYTATVPPPTAICEVSTTSPPSWTTATAFTYTGSSSGGSVTVNSWSWSFDSSFSGRGASSQMVGGNYTNPGTYTATVYANYSDGSQSNTANCPSVTVTAAPPVASFSASQTEGSAPLAVTFTNDSTGTAPLTYAWTFGDGSPTSNELNPSHPYATAGTFNVNLTVTDGNNQTATAQPVSITVTAASANNGLVAAYNFQEATGAVVVDESGNGNHGALSCNTAVNASCTAAARTTSGKFGKAISFDGVDDFMKVNDSASLDLTNGMTLEAWVYPTDNAAGWHGLLNKENSTTNGDVYLLEMTTGSNYTSQLQMVSFIEGGYQGLLGQPTLANRTWTHVAATYDGATEQLYIDGTPVASREQSGNMAVSTGALRIGANTKWGEYFKGSIDEIRIYNRPLSQGEIQTDRTTSVVTKLLVGDSSTTKSVTDAISQNVAKAFKKKATVAGKVTSLRIYVNSGSTSTKLVAGLYEDNNGHPGALRAQGALNNPKASAWNTVPLSTATSVTKDSTYWIAILSPTGILQFRDKVGGAAQPSETSAETNLTSLLDTWTTGMTGVNEGPLAGYGAGS